MRKLKLQVQVSVDGFIAGPNGEIDWMVWNWDEELNKYISDLTASIDCIVLGRKLAEGFIPYWTSVAANPEDPQNAAIKIFSSTPKIVFSMTLENSTWENTELAKDELVTAINRLKNQDGKDSIAYGGTGFVSSLIRSGLIGAFHFMIIPKILGNGMPIFQEIVENKAFNC